MNRSTDRRRQHSRCSSAPVPATAARDTALGWCPGIRRPGCNGTSDDTAQGRPAVRASARSCTAEGPRSPWRSAIAAAPEMPRTAREPGRPAKSVSSAAVTRDGVRPRSFQRWITAIIAGGTQRLVSTRSDSITCFRSRSWSSEVEDCEIRLQPDKFRVTSQHARAERVEGTEPQSLDRPADDGADPFAHLPRGLVGECHRQDLARVGTAGQQDMSEACGQHAGLAGPRAGEDEKGTIHRLDSFPLFGIQARKVVGHGQGIRRAYRLRTKRGLARIISAARGLTPRICAIA